MKVAVRLSEAPMPARPLSMGLTAIPGLGATAADCSVPTTITFERGETRALVEVVSLPAAEEDDGETVTLGFGGTLQGTLPAGAPAASTVTILDPTDRGRPFTDHLITPG